MQINKTQIIMMMLLVAMGVLQSCKDDSGDSETNDTTLFDESTAGDLIYFRNGDVLDGKAPSPHGSFTLGFNAIAADVLDSNLTLPPGQTFPEGSLIVKEVQSGGNTTLLAVMKKEPTHDKAAEGWIWAEYKPGGDVAYGIRKKGKACTGCHGGNPNRDFVRVFDLH